MFFTQEPKIKRVARFLKFRIEEECQKKWVQQLDDAIRLGIPSITPQHFEASYVFSENEVRANINDRPREHYSRNIDFLSFHDEDETPEEAKVREQERKLAYEARYKEAVLHYMFYCKCLEYIEKANTALDNADYDTVISNIHQMQAIEIATLINEDFVTKELRLSELSSNGLLDVFFGLGRIPVAAFEFAIGTVFFLPYCFAATKYIGSPQFMLDTAIYFFDALFTVISTLIFPIGMLHAKYTTDSCNILQDDLTRSMDSIIRLAQRELPESGETETFGSEYSAIEMCSY